MRVFVDEDEVTHRKNARGPALIAELVSSREMPVTTDLLLERVWHEPPGHSSHKLHLQVNRLRERLGAEAIVTRANAYQLNPDLVTVDAWTLEDDVARRDVRALARTSDVWHREPFAGFNHESEAMQLYRARLDVLRDEALELVASQLPLRQLEHHFDLLVAELDSRATNHTLAVGVAAILQARDRLAEALDVIVRTREKLLEDRGLSPPEQLADAELSLLQGKPIMRGPTVIGIADGSDHPQRWIGHERELSSVRDALTRPRSRSVMVLVEGRPGVGKTTFLDRAVRQLSEDFGRVRSETSSSSLGTPYGLLASVIPDCFDEQTESDHALTTAVAWRHIKTKLEDVAEREGSQLLVLDNLHEADSASLAFIKYFMETTTNHRVAILASTRPLDSSRSPAWAELQIGLVDSGRCESLSLGPLSAEDIRALLEESYPGLRNIDYEHSARQVFDATDGIAIDIAMILQSNESLPNGVGAVLSSTSERFLARVEDPRLETVLGLAAVIGVSFDLESLMAVTNRDIRELSELIVAAMRSDLVAERADGTFRFVHAVAAQSFADRAPLRLRQQAHWLLANDVTQPDTSRVRHVRGSGPLAERGVAWHQLMDSAFRLRSLGLYPEASATIEEALIHAADSDQHADTYILAADVASRLGEVDTAAAARSAALEHIAVDDHERRKSIALSGLPDGESPFPEHDRRRLFDAIADEELMQPDFDYEFHRMHIRITWLCDDLPAARGVIERLRSHRSHTDGELPGWAEIEYESIVVDSMSPVRSLEAAEMDQLVESQLPHRLRAGASYRHAWNVLRSWEPDFDAAVEQARSHAKDAGAAKTEYLCELLSASVSGARLTVDDHRDQTPPALDFQHRIGAAFRHGVELGISGIEDGHLSQIFQQHWMAGRLADLADVIALHPRAASDLLVMAAASLGLAHVPERASDARDALQRCLDGLSATPESVTSADAAALAIESASVLSADVDVGPALEILNARAGEGLVGALGAIWFGPVDRYRALALRLTGAEDAARSENLLTTAAEQCSELGYRYWEDRCRHALKTRPK